MERSKPQCTLQGWKPDHRRSLARLVAPSRPWKHLPYHGTDDAWSTTSWSAPTRAFALTAT